MLKLGMKVRLQQPLNFQDFDKYSNAQFYSNLVVTPLKESVMLSRQVARHSRDIGRAIRRKRKSKGLSLKELAYQGGISISYLSRIETGARPLRADMLCKLAEALNIRPFEFLIGD